MGKSKNPTIVIGIGGTGVRALDVLKKKMLEKDGASSDENIRLLAIDSDVCGIWETCLDCECEFVNASLPVPPATFLETARLNPQYDWLDQKSSIPCSIGMREGACGNRQLGRIQIIEAAKPIYDRIRMATHEVTRETPFDSLDIHIITSTSGGIGSGGYLDVCYMVREALHYDAFTNYKIYGYCVLPDLFAHNPGISCSKVMNEAIYRNGYEMLTELNDFMDSAENKKHFVQTYGEFSIDSKFPPVDVCLLMSGLVVDESYKGHKMKYCIEEIVNCIEKGMYEEGEAIPCSVPFGLYREFKKMETQVKEMK